MKTSKEKSIGGTFQDIKIGNDFLNNTPITQELIARTAKLDCIKLKCCYTAKETINSEKR
jgi:hypothetical protein